MDSVDDGAPKRAMRVAAALAAKRGDEFAKPGNLIEIKFVKGQSLSLTASRLLALMILTAGGDAWRAIPHKMRMSEIRRGHKSNDRISDMLEELHRTLFAIDDLSWRGRKATRRFSLILSSKEEAEDQLDGATGWIEWEFTPDARTLIQASESYAVMNRQAVLGFKSAYALKLYEVGALRLHRRQSTWRADMTALRAAFGIAPEIYSDFAQLRRKVLERAKIEIDQLAHFTVEWEEFRRGRTIAEVEFRFLAKSVPNGSALEPADAQGSAGAETGGAIAIRDTPPAVGRLAALPPPSARDTAKPTSPPAREKFPEGSVRYNPRFADVAKAYGGGWDIDLIAAAYREQMGARLERLEGTKLRNSWLGFCEAFLTRRGRPG